MIYPGKLPFGVWKAVESKDGHVNVQNKSTMTINRLLKGKTYYRGVTLEILTNEETAFLDAMYKILWCSKHDVVPTKLDNRLGMYQSEKNICKLVKLVSKLEHYRRACNPLADLESDLSASLNKSSDGRHTDQMYGRHTDNLYGQIHAHR